MPEYLIELYVAQTDTDLAATDSRRVHEAAEQLTKHGTAVRYLRSIFVPTDETCFILVEADSADDVYSATRLANVPCNRVSRAVSHPCCLEER
jgi:hypothetical protein